MPAEADQLSAAIDRLAETVGRMATVRGKADPAAGLELDADKTSRVRARPPGSTETHDWAKVGEILAAAQAKILGPILDRHAPPTTGTVAGKGDGGGGASARTPAGRPATRFGRFKAWAGATRPVKAIRGGIQRIRGSRVGRTAAKVGGAIAGSMAGRAVGSMVGALGGPLGAVVGGLAGGAIGGAVGSRAAGGPGAGASRGGMAGGATGAIVGGILGGPFGAVAGGVGGAALGGAAGGASKALDGFKKQTEETTKVLMAANRRLAEFSGLMTIVATQERVREMNRDREKGDRLAPSATVLMEAEQRRKDNTKETEILGQRFNNWMTSIQNDIVTMIGVPLNEIAGIANEMLGDSKRTTSTLAQKIADAKLGADEENAEAKDRRAQQEAWDKIKHGRKPDAVDRWIGRRFGEDL